MTLTHRESPTTTHTSRARLVWVAAALSTVAGAAAALVLGAPPELGLLAGFAAWRLRAQGA